MDSASPSSNRRQFLKHAAILPLAGASLPLATLGQSSSPNAQLRSRVNATLLSATTVVGGTSLGHAFEPLREAYSEISNILLLPFASLPQDRDAYARRMQRDFSGIEPRFKVKSLHQVAPADAPAAVRDAEAFFVSGGNTFLLLRELYDRYVVDLIRERILQGVPYAGSSAGSNIAGTVIGTTNDFPITDIPTRRSFGLLSAVFNPHHPDKLTHERDFGSRQWKIGQYTEYNTNEVVVGVTDPGVLRIQGDQINLRGENAAAYVVYRNKKREVTTAAAGDVSKAIRELKFDP